MRPIERGNSPRPQWTDYGDARPDLERTIGDYCSYCEVPNVTDVEHKLPKHIHPVLEKEWSNFLLACKSCNAIKHDQQAPGLATDPASALATYLWPDADNTARAFVYHPSNDVTVNPNLPPALASLAAATIAMTGIDRIPGKTPGPTYKDKRWRKRFEAWQTARIHLQLLVEGDSPQLRRSITDTAAATGFWSVWRTVFAANLDMVRRLDIAFKGTAASCFDPTTGHPVPRTAGRL